LGAVAFLAVLQFQERYRWSWLRSEGLPFALQLGLATVVGLQAVAFFAGMTLQYGLSNILSVNNNIANFAISVGREYVLIALVLAGLAWRGRLTWWAAGGFLSLLLGMCFVYLGHLNPWGLKTTIPVTLLMPFAAVGLISAMESRTWRTAFLALVLVYLTPSFVYETFFAWNDESNQVTLEKTKWIVDQYLGLPKN
jgi:hypothetical protein